MRPFFFFFGASPEAGSGLGVMVRNDGQKPLTQEKSLLPSGLVDACLATELGSHRLHAHAVGLDAAVAAAFADALVDDNDLDRFLGLAAAARAAQFGGAFLVVDQHGRALGRGQRTLRFVEPVTVPEFGAAG